VKFGRDEFSPETTHGYEKYKEEPSDPRPAKELTEVGKRNASESTACYARSS
jgi:hypothetical protein